jgi:pimeloyl-ACP methyl ester carboxylesterase
MDSGSVALPRTIEHSIPNGDGWNLSLFQTWDERRLVPGRRPVLIVPGYGMNSFIFSWHPRGLSLEGYLADAGFEVWRVDMREQGRSRRIGRGVGEQYGLEDLALADLGSAVAAVLDRSKTGATRTDVLGASLGGTIMLAHAVLNPGHAFGTLVAIGSPVRWVDIHPVLRVAFSSPALAGMVRLRGTRRFAEVALPLLARRLPWVLSIYMNASITDTSAVSEMVKTVEDPNRHVNRQIARWIRDRDLVLRGVNIAEGLRAVSAPLLCVTAFSDGIVPRRTAEFPYHAVASPAKRLLEVGAPELAMSHADLFISNESQIRVFEPIAAWLREHGPAGPGGMGGLPPS